MTTFREFLAEQLQDPELRKWWEGRNELLVRQVNATMTLSDMPLDEMDKMRIRFAAEHPELIDAMLDELIREHTVDTQLFDAAMAEHQANPKTFTMEEVGRMLSGEESPDE